MIGVHLTADVHISALRLLNSGRSAQQKPCGRVLSRFQVKYRRPQTLSQTRHTQLSDCAMILKAAERKAPLLFRPGQHPIPQPEALDSPAPPPMNLMVDSWITTLFLITGLDRNDQHLHEKISVQPRQYGLSIKKKQHPFQEEQSLSKAVCAITPNS